ncbi:hypothetical protein HMPREF9515_02941 [Enterococcus faecalis TX0860]|nr:hypothetical protein HMPREF9515_02941 [Enterococcus faecalis TX0860]EPI30896.1 hypothetical protein D351_01279 [Enterococcus faecalis WKS-26-18-2]
MHYFEKLTKKSLGQKSLWIFGPSLKINKRREQKQQPTTLILFCLITITSLSFVH